MDAGMKECTESLEKGKKKRERCDHEVLLFAKTSLDHSRIQEELNRIPHRYHGGMGETARRKVKTRG